MELPALLSVLVLLASASRALTVSPQKAKCHPPSAAPHKLEKVIGQCQDEIKFALLQEALSVLGETMKQSSVEENTSSRKKREALTGEERRIAGCLLQCVYRKMKAVDEEGYPTATGLVKVYSEGVQDRNYYVATIQAVQQCLAHELRVRRQNPEVVLNEGYTCDVAYDMFNCVSDQIELICGTTP